MPFVVICGRLWSTTNDHAFFLTTHEIPHTFASDSDKNKPSAWLLLTTKKSDDEMKISVHRKEMKKLREQFPETSVVSIYRALRFETNSMRASVIRCYAMNMLQHSILFSTKKN